MKIGQYFPSYS